MKPSDFYYHIDDDHSVSIYNIKQFNNKEDSISSPVVDKLLDSIGFSKIDDILYEYVDEDADTEHITRILNSKGFISNSEFDKYILNRSIINDRL